jgi:hypothetical protein
MNWNKNAFSEFPYTITANNHFWTEHPEFDKKSGAEFSKLYRQAIENKRPVERDIRQAIAKWPTVAGFQWLLAECYSYNDEDQMDEVLDAMIENHPTSIFSVVANLGRVISHDEELPTYFGLDDSLELHELFPNRSVFHAFEVFLYEATLFMVTFDVSAGQCKVHRHRRYMALSTTLVNANQLAMLAEIVAEKHPLASTAATMESELENYLDIDFDKDFDDEDFDDEDDDDEDNASPEEMARRYRVSSKLLEIQTTEPPRFHLAVTEALYSAPMMLPDDLMQDLLAQDRALLIADLELVLRDAVVRFDYFRVRKDENYGSMHAFILLCHFQSVASIPAIVDFLSQPEYVLEYWLDDILEQNVPQWLAPMLQQNLNAFDALILDGDAYDFARIAGLATLEQFALHWPERKTDVEDHFLELLPAINAPENPTLGQPLVNSYISFLSSSLKMKRLHAAMQPLFADDKVGSTFIGSWKEAEKEFKNENNQALKMPMYLDDLRSTYHEGLDWASV